MATPNNKKNTIIKAFAKMCQKINRVPTIREFQRETGYTKDNIQYYFGGIGSLLEESKKKYPKMFKNCLHDVLTQDNVNRQKKDIKDY